MVYKTEFLSPKEMDKKFNSLSDVTVKCKSCGHSIAMPNADRTICSWCGEWVYRTPQIEFCYKMKERLANERRNMERH